MARKLRLEFPGAIYHVINRGNHRGFLFKSAGAKQAFEDCLFAACARSGWLAEQLGMGSAVYLSKHVGLARREVKGKA